MKARGLFRWAGSKRHLVEKVGPIIKAHLSATGGRLVSLFFGSGQIERAVGGAAVAADASPELLGLYADIARPEALHAELLDFAVVHSSTRETYDAVRLLTNLPPLTRSARFLWLSAFAFNGVWRVNAAGEMNMPADPARLARGMEALPPLAAFLSFAEQVKGTVFVKGWQAALMLAKPGDLIFADPPYGDFTAYTAGGFSARDQRLLAGALKEASARCGVIAFNEPVKDAITGSYDGHPLYHWAKCEAVTRSGCVSSKATDRDPVTELVITAGLRGGR